MPVGLGDLRAGFAMTLQAAGLLGKWQDQGLALDTLHECGVVLPDTPDYGCLESVAVVYIDSDEEAALLGTFEAGHHPDLRIVQVEIAADRTFDRAEVLGRA
ncbi:MAG: hypothetical protein IT365_00065 [Candidatus Hydrogenedentes bacterium]|nr:hypothetical protein [Candidatus Hydrogenedentota bacterium]